MTESPKNRARLPKPRNLLKPSQEPAADKYDQEYEDEIAFTYLIPIKARA